MEFTDDQAGLVDLSHNEKTGGLELKRRLVAPKNRRGLIAGHLDPERKAALALFIEDELRRKGGILRVSKDYGMFEGTRPG